MTYRCYLRFAIALCVAASACGRDCPAVENPENAVEEAFFSAEDPNSKASFGISTDVAGDYAIVAPGSFIAGGAAQLRVRQADGTWVPGANLVPAPPPGKESATMLHEAPVALHGTTAVVSGILSDASGVQPIVSIFELGEAVWSQTASLDMPDNALVVESLALHEDTLAVGLLVGTSFAAPPAVALYVRGEDGWTHQQTLRSPTPNGSDRFGDSLDLHGDTLVVGDVGAGENFTGEVHVFVRTERNWSLQQTMDAPDARPGFGDAVAVFEDTIAVSSRKQMSATIYIRNGDAWSSQATLQAAVSERDDGFGSTIALGDGVVVVGAAKEDGGAAFVNGNQCSDNARDSGAAYVFMLHEDAWKQVAYLKGSNTVADDRFGDNVSIDGDTIVVGAGGRDVQGSSELKEDAGAAYVFRIDRERIFANLDEASADSGP